ncbi:RAMP4 family protein [Streptomyces pinistramenti]|uniref:RAMP4 family protein n=1 Tax=Streptomyces pinistramenti TaxID=2884812 RepID=UPI001D071C14|nr:RAMP4 family protein [Streptomyces pinistramenti]MCB5911290.1 RAMP4 family protein [Streptomyces pinistramenti]
MMSATSTLALTHFVTLADSFDKDKVTPGVLGFIVFAVIGGAVWLLMKSMNRHMKKVDFEESSEGGEAVSTTPAAPKAAQTAKPKTS